MGIVSVTAGRNALVEEVAGTATTTNIGVRIAATVLDARAWRSIAYTLRNTGATNTARWRVDGSSDGTNWRAVQALADVAPGANVGFALDQAIYSYYRVVVLSKVAGSHTTVSARGILKATE